MKASHRAWMMHRQHAKFTTALFFIALALRVLPIGVFPTTDEAITMNMVEQFGTVELVTAIPKLQPHFPLYYILLDLWASIAPLRFARVLSIVAGAAVPAIAYCWFRELTDEWRAGTAALLLVVAPPLVVQSRWLRMYALLTAAVLLSWWAAWRWLHGNGRAVTYATLSVAVVGLHPFGVAAVASQLTWLAIEQYQTEWRRGFRAIVGSGAAIGAAGVVWLLWRVADSSGVGAINAGDMHIRYSAIPALRAFVLPLATLTGTLHNAVFLFAGIAVSSLLVWWSYQRRVWKTRTGRLWLCWIVGALAVLYVGHAIRPVLMLKYVTWLAPGVAFAFASLLPGGRVGDVAFGSVVGIAAVNLVFAFLVKLSAAMVAIWGSGVTEPGAL